MTNQGKKITTITLLLLAFVTACAKQMNSEDFAQITAAWAVSMIQEALSSKDWKKNDRERKKIAYRKLEKICKKYGYSATDYKRKAQELGKNWEKEWQNIQDNLNNH